MEIEGVLLTMADFRTNLTTEVINEIQNYFKDKVYKTVIPRNVKLSEAPSFGKPISVYDRNSIGAKKYEEFAVEFLGEKYFSQIKDREVSLEMSKEDFQNKENITLNE